MTIDDLYDITQWDIDELEVEYAINRQFVEHQMIEDGEVDPELEAYGKDLLRAIRKRKRQEKRRSS